MSLDDALTKADGRYSSWYCSAQSEIAPCYPHRSQTHLVPLTRYLDGGGKLMGQTARWVGLKTLMIPDVVRRDGEVTERRGALERNGGERTYHSRIVAA